MFGNSSFNNYQLIVIPFLQALLFQSIYDYLAPAIQKYLNKYFVLIAISILFFAISPSSLFNDFPNLKFIPTQRSYVLFSPTNFKLLIIYILLLQSLIELEKNSKKIPISLFLLTLIYLTTLPLLLVSFSLFTCWLLLKREYLNAIKNVIYIFTICVICISLLKWNFNEDSSLLIENVFNKNISLILAIKYFVVSLIQIIALSWLLIFLIFIIIFRIGVQKFKDKYHFWLFIFVPPLILGALIFPYAKEFGFDNDQYLYNLIIPLISASSVYFIKEVLIFKSITQTPKTLFLLVLILFYSVFLNTSTALNSWKYYRPPFYKNVSNEFILEIGDTFNSSEKKWKGISIRYKDTLHWSYSSGYETWQLGDGWISSYLKNSIAPSNFSRFYFQDNGKNLMLKKKYVIQLLKKNNIKDIDKYSNKDLIEIFIKKSDLDYLICDFDIERSFTNCFKDSIQDKKSKLKIYFNNIHISDFMKPATK